MSDVRLLNASFAGDRLRFEDPATDFARFDHLPPELRWRIANNNTKAAAAAFEAHYRWSVQHGHGARRTIAKIDAIERNEIAVFAGEYRAAYGTPLPHVAAEVSIQRYGVLGASQHPPRRYGKPHLKRRQRKGLRA